MTYNILVLGASYGSLLGTKLAAAGHNATLVCRTATADLIRENGSTVIMPLKGDEKPTAICSSDLKGKIDAIPPEAVEPAEFDLVVLAMSEPQYAAGPISVLMRKIALSGKPCLSLMNMPPLPYLARFDGINIRNLVSAYTRPDIWDGFAPGLVSLCSPDPQAFRQPDRPVNELIVGLPTNFKAAAFENAAHTAILKQLEDDIEAVRFNGKEVPVKLRVHDSLFVPFAKWSMLLTGNYRCVQAGQPRSIHDAVYDDLEASAAIYGHVQKLVEKLGAQPGTQVPFEKYAAAARNLKKPSSVARAILAGATEVERVDLVIQSIAGGMGMQHPAIDEVVTTLNAALDNNRRRAA